MEKSVRVYILLEGMALYASQLPAIREKKYMFLKSSVSPIGNFWCTVFPSGYLKPLNRDIFQMSTKFR